MGRNKAVLLQSHIELAMSKTNSNMGAAKYLGTAYSTYKKYASLYFKEGSEISLFEQHKNPHGKRVSKLKTNNYSRFSIEDILVHNKCPNFPKERLKAYLLQDGYFQPRCNNCGFDEQRISDSKIPLMLNCKDGNKENLLLENLELLCYNCYFLFVGNIIRISTKLPRYLSVLHSDNPDESTITDIKKPTPIQDTNEEQII